MFSDDIIFYTPTKNKEIIGYRQCSVCKRQLPFYNKEYFDLTLDMQIVCFSCLCLKEGQYKRICPKCGRILEYRYRRSFDFAIDNNCNCWGCAKRKYYNGIDRIMARRRDCRKYQKKLRERKKLYLV